MTQKKIILKILDERYPEWVPVWNLMLADSVWGYLGTSGDRRCRELRADGQIEVKEVRGFAHYRIIKEPVQLSLIHV